MRSRLPGDGSRLQLKPAQGRERQQCWNRTEGGDRGGSNVTILLLGGSKSQDGEKPGGEVWTARKTPLSGTPERSNPNRELVERKLPSGSRRHIRKRDRQLTRASKGRHGASAHRVNPTEVWNKVARRRKGSRMWRLAGEGRSTRFELAS